MGDREAVERETQYVKDLPGYHRTDPQFFKDKMIDKLLEIVLMIGGELWSVRDRQMVMEHLLATQGVVTPDLIETFRPDEAYEQRTEAQRLEFVQRVFGSLYPKAEKVTDHNHFRWLTDKKNG